MATTRATVESLQSLALAGTSTLTDFRAFLNGPLTATTNSSTALLTPSALLMVDLQKKFHPMLNPEPYKGNHPRLHKLGVGAKTGLSFVPYAADGVRIANGGR
jgi:hypothetical protein